MRGSFMKFHSKPIPEHAEVPLADQGQLEALIALDNPASARGDNPASARGEGRGRACYLLSTFERSRSQGSGAQLAEIQALVESQGDHVVGSECHGMKRIDPRTWVGRGVAQRVGEQARAHGAEMLVLDAELSPSQLRNLEDVVGMPICDREAVILNVFQRHARTDKARVQVELAHLQYLRPRIRGIGLSMDKQAAGMMKARGPGETASELLARQLDGRLAELRRRWEQLQRASEEQRKQRKGCKCIVLLGYTNAGKTSIMNGLTGAGLSARNRPFETLDTTSRCLSRQGDPVLISDTVGFIRRLPQRLLQSFASTLDEVGDASLLLIVVDASDPEAPQHMEVTHQVLDYLGAGSLPRFILFNKCDRLPEGAHDHAALSALAGTDPHRFISAHDGEQVAALRAELLSQVRAGAEQCSLFVPYERAELQRRIYESPGCRVIEAKATERGVHFRLEAAAHVLGGLIAERGRMPR